MTSPLFFIETEDRIDNAECPDKLEDMAYDLNQQSAKLMAARRIRFSEGFGIHADLAAEMDNILEDWAGQCCILAKRASERAETIREDRMYPVDDREHSTHWGLDTRI